MLDLKQKNHRVSYLGKKGDFIHCVECAKGCYGDGTCEFCPSLSQRTKLGCGTGTLIDGLDRKRRLVAVTGENGKVRKVDEME